MALTRREVAERHLESAADLRVELMHAAGKSVGRQPLRHGVRFGKGAIDLVGLGCKNAVQSDGVGHGCFSRAGAATSSNTTSRPKRERSTQPAWRSGL